MDDKQRRTALETGIAVQNLVERHITNKEPLEIAAKRSDGKTITVAWLPWKESAREALERAGLSKMARIE